jgi:drug/metabolite transporter (DMT)-like permease
MKALLALLIVTAVWGVTFVQVKDAVEVYPLFAFLAVRFAIASATLAVPGARRLRSLGRRGLGAGVLLGTLLAAGYALQTAGLERTTPSSAGFITGLYVVLVPLVALALFREQIGRGVWVGVGFALAGLALLSGVDAGSVVGDVLVLGCALAFGFQIPLTGRFAPHYDPLALTLVQMLVAFVGFAAIALALGELELPHGRTVWAALLVTGVFASALAYLIQTWAQRTISAARTAVVYAMEPVFAGLFGYLLAGDRLGTLGWAGCALILAGIVASEPAAAEAIRRSIRRSPGRPRRRARSGPRSAGP